MPYISPGGRAHYDDAISLIITRLSQRDFAIGDINYVITKILKATIRYMGRSYVNYNALIGVLECVKQEFYRRDVVPYEEEKITENGDID